MLLKIDPEIFKLCPDFKLGAIILRGIDNSKRVSSVESLLRGICAQREKQFKEADPFEDPMIQCWSSAYGNFGVNPKKYPPSIAALLKRVRSGKDLPHINLLVDLYNYFSLKYLLPIGGEDLDWLHGDLELTFTKGGEPFRPIGSIDVEFAKEGEAAYKDRAGITCRYWNYRECERTKFTSKTRNALILIEDMSKMHMDEFGSILRDVQNNLIKYIGGQIEPYILNEENRQLDLQVEGRTHGDDSKIPQQEVAHYLATHPGAEYKEAKKPEPKRDENAKQVSMDKVKAPEKLNLSDAGSTQSQLFEIVKNALAEAFEDAVQFEDRIKIDYPAQAEHGDYASNIALAISKDLGKNPREVAEAVSEKIVVGEMIKKVEVAGPGFINIFVSDEYLNSEVDKVLGEKEKYGLSELGAGKNLVVEYSQPNIAKPLGVHHLLSTIIGQSLYNIFDSLGFNAISVNHTGDWGTQFGKLIYAFKQWGDKATVETDPINELLKLYIKFHDEAEKDETLVDRGREEFKKFEEGDKENRELWQWFVDESYKEILKTYKHLGGVRFDHMHPESFYEDKMDSIIQAGKEMGIFVEGKEGALVIEYEDENIPTLPVIKKDGSTLYITRDFAALKYRLENWDPVRILYVVDVAQSLHFQQLFAAAAEFEWFKPVAKHIVFGRMQLKDQRMSTRKGTVILLDDVLKEAEKRAKEIIEEKNPNIANIEDVARAIGIGAVKYSVLSQNRNTNITFDWDKMLSFDGNSAPYLQYTYARARSILRKAQALEADPQPQENSPDSEDTAQKIHALLSQFPKFQERTIAAAVEYKPNIIANFVFDFAQTFNAFYNAVPVLRADSPEKVKERLKIVEASAQIIKNALSLLGVEVVEEM